MLEILNKTNQSFNDELLHKIASFLTPKDIELLLVDDKEMTQINFTHRQKNQSTDVLSFPFCDMGFDGVILGSIVININIASKVSKKLNHELKEEIALLFIHGLLHLLGFDHEIDNGEQRNKEVELIAYFNLPQSLILRTENF